MPVWVSKRDREKGSERNEVLQHIILKLLRNCCIPNDEFKFGELILFLRRKSFTLSRKFVSDYIHKSSRLQRFLRNGASNAHGKKMGKWMDEANLTRSLTLLKRNALVNFCRLLYEIWVAFKWSLIVSFMVCCFGMNFTPSFFSSFQDKNQ